MRIVVLDVDDTLTELNSWSELTHALGASLDEHLRIYRELPPDAPAQVVALWQATGNATRPNLIHIFERLPLRPGAPDLVNWLHANDFHPVLLSGSMDLYVATVARRLGVPTWFATSRLEFDATGTLTALIYEPDQAAAKLRLLRQFCAETGIDPRTVTVVGDGANDAELFAATGRGILVGTPPAPTPSAWRSVATLADIPPLLSP